MSQYISDVVRAQVTQRALFRCEYCLRAEADSFIRYQIDHIISLKHEGKTVPDNLALSCVLCNGNKGPNIGTVLADGETFVRLFHPRKDRWADHFVISEEGMFMAQTDIGAATIKVLDLNAIDRILERLDLIKAGLFP